MATSPTAGGMRQLPLYQCYKRVWALKIQGILPDEMPKFSRPTCRGCVAFGTACGKCERCIWERDTQPNHGARLVPSDELYAPFRVTREYLTKHNPQIGGYWVQYEDGYQSFSPADAFEEGYTRL